MTIAPKEMDQEEGYHPRSLVYQKMEMMVREMQNDTSGVPIRSQKSFLNNLPAVFTGYDLMEWLGHYLCLTDPSELIHIAGKLCSYGYVYPVAATASLCVKDDNSLYRFQAPYFWPAEYWESDSVDYAIYLAKRTLQNEKKYGLDQHEVVALNKLKKLLCDKWDFIFMQARDQLRIFKERKKSDRTISSREETAFWRVHKPMVGESLHAPDAVRRHVKIGQEFNTTRKNIGALKKEVDYLTKRLAQSKIKMSKHIETYMQHQNLYKQVDPMLANASPEPSNPWVSDDITMWMINTPIVDTLTERRLKKWSFSLEELLSDATGRNEFLLFLEKEYSSENLHFWIDVENLKGLAQSKIAENVDKIYHEYMGPNAVREINIDSKTHEETMKAISNPTRFSFDQAEAHIIHLMKKDSYQRFLRSEQYRNLVANALIPSSKKKFFSAFSNRGKKSPGSSPPHGNKKTQKRPRRGSTSSTGTNNQPQETQRLQTQALSQHSYSTGNLQDLDTPSDKTSATSSIGDVNKSNQLRSLSPSSFIKRLNDIVVPPNKNTNVPAKCGKELTTPNQNKINDQMNTLTLTDQPSSLATPTDDVTIVVPKHNVVAPWEEEDADQSQDTVVQRQKKLECKPATKSTIHDDTEE